MRKLFLAATLAACFLVTAIMSAGPASAAGYVSCAGSYGPQGAPGGGFYGRIKAKRITCTTAKKVTLAWIKSHADGTKNPTKRVKVLGYSCKGQAVIASGETDGGLAVLCTRATKAVRFSGHP